MAFTSSRTKIELLSPIDGSVLVNITTKGRSASVSRRPTYASRGYHRSAAVTAARLRTQGTVTLQLNADDLALLHELERWQKGVVWYPMAADLKGRRHRHPDLRITFLDAQGAVEEVVTAYGVKLSDESLDLGMGPAKESISLDVLGGFDTPPRERGEPVRALDFHRTGPATYLSPDGLKTAGDGHARFGLPGAVVRRNLFNNSVFNGTAGWGTTNIGTILAVAYPSTLPAGYPSSIGEGKANAVKMTIASGQVAGNLAVDVVLKAGETITLSGIVYIPSSVVSGAWKVVVANSGFAVVAETPITERDQWVEKVVAYTAPSDGTYRLWFGSTGASTAGQYMLVAEPQWEKSASRTPYQPTNATGVEVALLGGLILEGGTTNLIDNPDNEDALASLNGRRTSARITMTQDSAIKYSGSYSLKSETSGTGGNADNFFELGWGAGQGSLNGMIAGKTYTVSCKAYVPSASGPSLSAVFLRVFYRDSSGSYATPTSNKPVVTGRWGPLSVTFSIPAGATEAFIRCYTNQNADGLVVYWDEFQLEEGAFPTSFVKGTRQPDLAGIVYPQNELIHSHDLTQSPWVRTAGASVSKSGTANTLTLAATTDAVTQAATPPNVPGTTRTIAAKLRLGTLSGSVRLRLLDQAGTQIASTTISTADLHATDTRTFTVTGTPGANVTGLRVQIIGNAGTGTVIVESLRLVRGYHPGIEVRTTDTPILPPPSPALDPAWSQNGRVKFRAITPFAYQKKIAYFGKALNEGPVSASDLGIGRTSSDGSGSFQVYACRRHNGGTGNGGIAGSAYASTGNINVWDNAPHDWDFEWTNEIRESDGVREMWLRLYVNGALRLAIDVAALYGATAWADIDPSRLISDGTVNAVISGPSSNPGGVIIEFPRPRAGYRQVDRTA